MMRNVLKERNQGGAEEGKRRSKGHGDAVRDNV